MPSQQRKIGDLGEEVCCKYLQKHHYKILERNFFRKNEKSPLLGELDIVAKKQKTIHFIEVKTSASRSDTAGVNSDFLPERRVNWLKQRKLVKAGQIWLIKNKIPSETPWQIDIISLQIDFSAKKAKIKHFKNAVY
jgi:putative endonuclease